MNIHPRINVLLSALSAFDTVYSVGNCCWFVAVDQILSLSIPFGKYQRQKNMNKHSLTQKPHISLFEPHEALCIRMLVNTFSVALKRRSTSIELHHILASQSPPFYYTTHYYLLSRRTSVTFPKGKIQGWKYSPVTHVNDKDRHITIKYTYFKESLMQQYIYVEIQV